MAVTDVNGNTMAAAEALAAELAAHGIHLRVEDGGLRFDAPAGAFDAVLKDRVRAARSDLMALLAAPAVAPLSSGQERMWFLNRLGGAGYTEHLAFRFDGPLDIPALSRALTLIVGRHPALRTRFRDGADGPEQVIEAPRPLDLPILDLTGQPDALDGELDKAAHRPVDLASDPHVRFQLLMLGPDRAVLSVSAHHAAWDGWSNGVFIGELQAAYAAHVQGTPAALPALATSPADMARQQRQRVANGDDRPALDGLRRLLADFPTRLDLPGDRPRPAVADGRGAALAVRIPPDLARPFVETTRRHKATPYMALLAAYALLLARLSGASRLLVGAPVAARRGAAEEMVIGYLSNTVAIPVDLDGAASFAALIDRVRAAVLAVMETQLVPFEQVVDAVSPPRSRDRAPLVQAVFALQPATVRPPSLPGLVSTVLTRHNEAARFDLMLNLEPTADGGFAGPLTYATSLFDAATIDAWAARFLDLLRTLPAAWDAPLDLTPQHRAPLAAAPVVVDRHAPATPTETRLSAIWAEFLTVPAIGRDDDFFMLGGHSLMLMRVVNRITETGLGRIGLAEAMAATRLSQMAAVLDGVPAGSVVVTDEIATDEIAPASEAEEGLWLIRRDQPQSVTWNVPALFALDRPTAPDTVRAALTALVTRHPALRTTLLERDGVILRRIAAPTNVMATLLTDLDRPGRAAAMRGELARPINLERGPICRFVMFGDSLAVDAVFLVVDHAMIDGWSLEVLRRELPALLDATRSGTADPLPPPSTTPTARHRRRADDLAGARGEVLRRYWLAALDGMDLGDLPGAAARPPGQEPRGRRVVANVSGEVLESLERLARAGGTTATVAWAAAVGALLVRLKGDGRDVSVAMPFADRPSLEDAELVGCLANVLPLRLSGSWSRSFADHLAETRRAVAGAVAHQGYPFRRIVADVLAARGSQAPLFDAVVVVEEPDPAAADWSDAELGAGKYDLAFMLGRLGPGRATLSVEYDAGLYDEAAARALARRLEILVIDAARRMDADLGELAMLPPAEWALITETFAGSPEPYPREASLATLWRAAATQHGARPALLEDGRTISYAALASRADAVAAGLRAKGLISGPGVGPVVGHAFARGADAIAAILGTIQAGAAYLPLDSRMPPALVRTLMADAGATMILADPANAARLAQVEGLAVCSLADIETAGRSVAPMAPATDGGSIAYIMFTSGSTGTPKGVMVPHRAVARLAFGESRWPVQPGDRIPQIAPLGFDASTLEIWCTLLNGGQLLILTDEEILDPAAMGAALRRGGVAGMWITAGLFNRVADDDPAAFAGLRFLYTGGEIVSPPHLRRVMDACPDTALCNGYGPTENGVLSTVHSISRSDLDGAVPIGRPVIGTRVYVLDERLQPVPVGIWGELCAAGDGVAGGYAGRPDLTAAAFRSLPWRPEERVYRTGDIARWRGDGVLEFAGRRDGQVKIRGQRIETGAIETVLSTIAGVRDAAVVVVGSDADRILAACVAAAPAEGQEDTWRRRIAAELPSYMMPALFVRLDALPVTANGKCDRRALAALAAAQVAPPAAGQQPLTGSEAVVARLFGDLFPNQTIDAGSDFVRLGGHSLMAMRLAHRLEEETGRRVTLRALLAAGTVAAIAALLPAVPDGDNPIPRAPDSADYPLSGGQERLWVMQRLFPDMAVYNVPLVFDVAGAFDDAAFARALQALEDRHHALRLRVVAAGSESVGVRQRLCPTGSLTPQMIDLTGAADPHAEAAQRMAAELAQPFRLEAETGVRAFVMRLDARTRRILLVLHHGICDGWSMGVLARDLGALYAAATTGATPSLPLPARQAEDVAVWQRSLTGSTEGKAALARWTERLTPPPVPLDLPGDRPRPPTRSYRGGIRMLSFDAPCSVALDRLAQAHAVTPFMLLLALTQVLLYRLSGQPDLALGTLAAGRDRAELRDTVGFLVNTLVLRQTVDPAQPFLRHLEATRAQCLQAIADQNCPFEALVEAVGTPRDLGRNPLFDVLVVWQDEEAPPPDLPGLTTAAVSIDFPFAKFDLGFHFGRRDGAIVCQLEFARDLFDEATVDALFNRLVTLARSVAADPGRPLRDLDILPAEERALVLDGFNATAFPHDCRRVISRLVLDRIALAPNLPAVLSDGAAALRYNDFARRAGRVAHRLVAAGVRPGEVVAVCLPRSPDLLVAIHGILMAGAAYAPLAADQPAARLAGMLDDLGCPVVLADADTRALVAGTGWRVLVACDGQTDEPLCLGEPDGLAYVIFTSGSTGRPKGVAIEHHSVLNRIQWMQRAFPIGPGDVILQKTPVTFDVSVWELFWWSWTGAAVAVPPPGLERDPAGLLEFVARHGVTVMHFVPSMLAAFLGHLESGRADAQKLRSLRFVFASGEALDAGLAERFERLLHRPFGTRLHNLYGPTEATVDVTWQPCSPWPGGSVVPIGRPIDNVRLVILDDAGRPAPIGVPGEIHLGGVQVARGYVNRPDLTAERFIADPFAPGGRLYRTGDLGRWRRDGCVEYLGRTDFQVKVRGQRIEPGEIEHVLEQHPAIERAIVLPATAQGLTELHGYLLAGPTLDSAAVRGHLRDRLPEAMVPARLFRLDSLPLTASGKVDRKALRGTALDSGPVTTAAPVEALEADILAIWRPLLPDVELGRHVGFFDAGGNSLLAIRLQERLEQRWPGVFTVTDLFACATIADQARRISQAQPDIAPAPSDGAGDGEGSHGCRDCQGAVAIVGMAVRLPGADDLAGLWRDVAAGADRVGLLPIEREADARALIGALGLPQPERFREAAWVEDLYGFAPRRLRMSPADAALIDPEQRLFLEVGLRALEDAGRGGSALDDARVGVFVGVSLGTAWRDAVMRVVPPARVEQAFALNVPSNVATRLSFLHNWRGPAALVDTACSSSLTAVHLACRALRGGECDWALVGGAKAILLPPGDGQRLTIDSSTGRTRAFAEGADGTGMGEGAVAFLLRPLERALAEGDPIHAVILGSAVNQDGASSGMAAPNPAAQAEVIRAAARDAGISLGSVSYVEAHGTGTALGDPIEIDGLTRAFAADTPDRGFAFIGSAKGNYGHLDGAAGALGLARAILALKHDRAPPQPFFTTPSSRIDFARAPVTVASGAPAALPDRGGPRRAGVSAFGLSGINAHVLLEAAAAPLVLEEPAPGWLAIGLSAPDQTALRCYAGEMVAAMRADPALPLTTIARTLTDGRDAQEARLAVWVRDRGDLMARLAVFAVAPDAAAELVVTGTADRAASTSLSAVQDDEAGALAAARAFVAGAVLHWPAGLGGGRAHLPVASQVRRRCAADFSAIPVTAPAPVGGSLLGTVVETPQGRFAAVDVHDPAFWPVAEHLLAGEPTLVGMAFPALLADLAGQRPLAIENLRWLRPLRPSTVVPGSVGLSLMPGATADTLKAELSGQAIDGRWLTFAQATVMPAASLPAPVDLAAVVALCGPSVDAAPFSGGSGMVQVSRRWDCLRRVAEGRDRAIAWFSAPARAGTILHPGLLDAATSVALDREGLVPAGCGRVVIAATLPDDPVVVVRRRPTADGLEADAIIASATDGRVAVAFHDLRFITVAPQAVPTAVRADIVPSVPVWREAPLTVSDPGGPLLVIGEGPWSDRIATHLAAEGRLAGRTGTTAPDATVLARLGDTSLVGVVLAAASGPDMGRRLPGIVRRIMTAKRGTLRLLAITEGAFAVGDDGPVDADQAITAGILQVAIREDTSFQASAIDVECGTPLAGLLAELAVPPTVPAAAVAWRQGRRLVRSFVPVQGRPATAAVWPESGCCVVTGGTGGLTLHLAETLTNNGRVALALISRSGEPPGDQSDSALRRDRLAVLRAAGHRLRIYACDVTDRDALGATLEHIRAELGPITAVVHNAGIPGDGTLAGDTPLETLAHGIAVKADGARALDMLTRDDPVQAFVLAGSLTGLIGAISHAAYTAGNAFLDTFAAQRRRDGRPGLAVDWCAIGEMGMAARLYHGRPRLDVTLNQADAEAMWHAALTAGTVQVALIDPAVRAMLDKPAGIVAPPRRGRALEAALAVVWAEVLGYDSVAADDDFYALGGDSIAGMQIVDKVRHDLGHSLSLSDVLDAGSVRRLAERLLQEDDTSPNGSATIPTAEPQASYPVAWEQLDVLQAEAADERGTAYNLPMGLWFPPDTDVERLRRAADELVARHEILRTRFRFAGDGEPVMEILPPAPVLFETVTADPAAPEPFLDWVRPFDLKDGAPVRFALTAEGAAPGALLFDVHHALADAFTMERLQAELAALYAGAAGPPPARQIKDYAWWSRRGAGAATAEAALAYWKGIFAGEPPVLDLPADRPRPARHTWRNGVVAVDIPIDTMRSLRRCAAERRTTPFVIMLAAWSILLHRYARTDDVVVAVPVDGRDAAGVAGMAGMMVSLLPLRLGVSEGDTLGGLIERVQGRHAEALRYRACTVGRILSELALPAAPDRTRLSEVSLSYMNFAEGGGLGGGGGGLEPFSLLRGDVKNDLSIYVRDLPDRMSIVLEYYADLFDAERMERMGRHFRTLLTALVVAAPDAPVGRLPLLDAEEAAWLAEVEQGAAVPLPTGLFAVVDAHAQANPDAIAIEDARTCLTYAQLLAHAQGVAAALHETGVAPGDRVAFHVERSAQAVALVVGLAAAGVVAVALDPAWPTDRIRWILDDAGVAVVIADAAGRSALGEAAADRTVLTADGLAEVVSDQRAAPPDHVPLHIMYTSGSTGLPKGVVVPQRAVLRLALGDDHVRLSPQDRVMQAGPLAFDASTFEIWGALLNGGCVCVIGRDDTLDPQRLAQALTDLRGSVLWMTAGLFNRQVEEAPGCFRSLRAVLTGGEVLSPSHLRRAMVANPGTTFFNGYGPTENVTFTAVRRIEPADVAPGPVPLGRPIPNTMVAVLDPDGGRTPVGLWGEIVAGGAGLAEGYLNRPDLTAERFVADPQHPGKRLYRTGDLGRWRRDGVLEFGGRLDGQVKLRGFRIELEEIEHAMAAHPAVSAAAAIFRPGEDGGDIVACVQPAGAVEDLRTLRGWLAKRLPAYMVPRRVVMVATLPVNANGKVDRARLAAMLPADDNAAPSSGEAPRDDAERLVAQVFAEVFGGPVEDRQASFMDLGGHSLLAIKVVNRIAQLAGTRLTMREFFADPTVAALARRIGGGDSHDVETIPRIGDASTYPASHAQARLFLAHDLDPNRNAYNITSLLCCGDDFDPTALRIALQRLSRRHETLRTAFIEDGGTIRQSIDGDAAPVVVIDDVSTQHSPRDEALRLARREAATPFDLARAPLLRARAVRVEARSWVVLLVLHHIVGDGWSMRVFSRELAALYDEACGGPAADLPALPIAYRDFAAWQAGRDWTDAAAYWRETLAGAADRIALPTDRAPSGTAAHRGDTVMRTLPAGVAEGLAMFARRRGVTVSTVGLALFAALLYRLTRQTDMTLGLGEAGRDHAQVEGLIGFFVNILPIRLQVNDDTEIEALVAQVNAAVLEAMDHRDYPFDLLVRAVAPRRSGSQQPLANVVYEYQRFDDLDGESSAGLGTAPADLDAGFLAAMEQAIHTPTAKHDVLLFVADGRHGTVLRLEYDSDLFDRPTAERWLAFYEHFASIIVAQADSPSRSKDAAE